MRALDSFASALYITVNFPWFLCLVLRPSEEHENANFTVPNTEPHVCLCFSGTYPGWGL